LRPEPLPPAVQTAGVTKLSTASATASTTASERSLDETLDDVERQMILAALGRAGGVQVRAARLLSITEQSLWYRIKKHGIQARVTGLPPTGSSPPASLPTGRPTPPQVVAPQPSSSPGEPVATQTLMPYRDLIRAAAARHGLAPELVESVIRVESNFEARAVSPKGARGLMQLMPATAAKLGVRNV